MPKYVIDASVVVHLLSEGLEPSTDNQILAPTLIRSEVLEALYKAVHRDELPEIVGLDRMARFSTMKIRYLGDKVLRRRAWSIAQQLGWESTSQAEYVALTQLQADAFITLDEDLASKVAGIVESAALEDLF